MVHTGAKTKLQWIFWHAGHERHRGGDPQRGLHREKAKITQMVKVKLKIIRPFEIKHYPKYATNSPADQKDDQSQS